MEKFFDMVKYVLAWISDYHAQRQRERQEEAAQAVQEERDAPRLQHIQDLRKSLTAWEMAYRIALQNAQHTYANEAKAQCEMLWKAYSEAVKGGEA